MHRSRSITIAVVIGGIIANLIGGYRPAAAYPAPVSTRVNLLAATATPITEAPVSIARAESATAEATPTSVPTATPTETPTPMGDPATSVQIGTGPFAFSVDLGDWIAKLLAGTWKALGVDGIKAFGDGIAGWLLRNPDLSTAAGQMGNVQRMADALRLAAVAVCVALFVAGVYRVWLGGEAPVSSLGRLLAVLVALGFYRVFVGWVVAGTNAVTDGVLHAGTNAATPAFGALLAAIPGTSPLWALAGVIALGFLFVLGVVRLLGYAFLLVAYVLGPVLLPLGLVPETAGYTALWAKHTLKLLVWPVLWATEFRLFDALKEGLYLPDSVSHAVLAPFAALGMLAVMFKTPLMLHSGSFEQNARTAVRVVRVAAGAAVTAFSGGAAAPVASAGVASGTATGAAAGAATSTGAVVGMSAAGARTSATATTTRLPTVPSPGAPATAAGSATGGGATATHPTSPPTVGGGQP